MKIGFNGRFILKPHTGIGQYSINLLMEMATQAPEVEWVVVIPEPLSSNSELTFPQNIRWVVVKEKKGWPSSLRVFWWEQVQVSRALQKEAVQLIHYPYPSNPRFRTPWNLKKMKTIVTVHDIIPWKRPEYRKKIRSRLYQNNAEKALKKADHVIAVSQTTALELTDHVQFPFHHISVIHEAASPIFSAKGAQHSGKNPYFIYVGGYDPRKNVNRLLEAYQEYIVPKYEVDLVLVGAQNAMDELGKGTKRLLEPLMESKMKNLHLTGAMSAATLADYYRGAIGFVNVSLAEGFNLPLLEAAASHLPILTSDLPIHREIIGSYGLFCDPTSTRSIGEMILNFLRDNELQEKLKEDSAELSLHYTWETAARLTLDLYKKLL